VTASSAGDMTVEPNIYRHKQRSVAQRLGEALRRRSLKVMETDTVDAGANKRVSAPVFGANDEVYVMLYIQGAAKK